MKCFLAIIAFASLASCETGSYSYYGCFQSAPSTSGYYADGHCFPGPFRANGPIVIYSTTPGRDNDPYFHSLTLSSDHYLYGTGPGGEQVTEPHWGNLWIEPYELMAQGPPWFSLGAAPLPFGADQVDWQSVRSAAFDGGLVLHVGVHVENGSRFSIRGDTLLVKVDGFGAEHSYDLSSLANPVVWVENSANDRIYIRGYQGSPLSTPVTIGMFGHLYMSGSLECSGAGMAGIISVYGDLFIADTPSGPQQGWEGYEIETTTDIDYQASLMALEGRILAENYTQPVTRVDFMYSGFQVEYEWYTGTTYSGFDMVNTYDERLLTQSPPFYPQYDISGTAETAERVPGASMGVSCNPFQGSSVVTLSSPATVQLFDQTGRLIGESGLTEQWILNGSDLPDGVYVLRAVFPGGGTESLRVVKLLR